MFRIFLATLVLTVFAFADGSVLKTGQITSYDTDGNVVTDGSVKDDGFYQMGKARSYDRSGDVVMDNATGLEWQDNENHTASWTEAITYCEDLPLDNGGWRLPTIEELETLLDDGKYNPSVSENVFQYISLDGYWSSTTYASRTYGAWLVNFGYGGSDGSDKTDNYYVRCVRGGQFDNSAINPSIIMYLLN